MSNNFFIEGKCKSVPCKYKYHIKCNKNVACFNFECCYGHFVSQNMRRLFKEITDEHKIPQYEKAINKCFSASPTGGFTASGVPPSILSPKTSSASG